MNNNPEAIRQCEENISRNPNDIASLNQLAMLLSSAGQHQQALLHISNALALAPSHPLLHYNLGQVHGGAKRFEEELAAYRQAIALQPDFIEAYVNMGVALRDMQQFDEALEAFKQAIRLNPEHPGARTNRAQTNLTLGNVEHGWRDYEWRWRDGYQRQEIQGTQWNGKASLKGKRLLIHAEQGLGDTLQFVRYLDLLKSLGATRILRVQSPLLNLLSDYVQAEQVIDNTAPLPAYDFHIPLLSLPHALYKQHPAIPSSHHYLKANPHKVTHWSVWLKNKINEKNLADSTATKKKLKVGLCWSGSTHHLNDQNRSMQLSQWSQLLKNECIFISLQKEVRKNDLETLAQHPQIILTGQALGDFEDTAALLCNLDLVITVDTSVAHLAGALGIPTWVLLPEPADWRWMLNRIDTPWYPSLKLFRQSARGKWDDVLEAVSLALYDQQSNMPDQN